QRDCADCDEKDKVQRLEDDEEREEEMVSKEEADEEKDEEEVEDMAQPKELRRQPVEEEEEEIATMSNELRRETDEEEDEETVSPKSLSGGTPQVTAEVQNSISSMKGGGQPLPVSTRAFFEPRFKRDFSGVRLHTDSRAAETAKSINARAFTVGRNIAFGAGQYSPDTSTGKQLLAHELTHTAQQSVGVIARENAAKPASKKKETELSEPLSTVSTLNNFIGPALNFKDWELNKLLKDGKFRTTYKGKKVIWKLKFQGNQTVLSQFVKAKRFRYAKSAKIFKVLGGVTNVAGGVISIVQWSNDEIGTPEMVADLAFSAIAFVPGYGWVVSGVYFMGKEMILSTIQYYQEEKTQQQIGIIRRLFGGHFPSWWKLYQYFIHH
ncbi:MAG: DUF4157 domain-containing protein, partial [Candidatus Marinimicrobia bacterium]|nr:DUF4157 domain-containing protein [Candidatus Neomarinimicrobiota bacterium]